MTPGWARAPKRRAQLQLSPPIPNPTLNCSAIDRWGWQTYRVGRFEVRREPFGPRRIPISELIADTEIQALVTVIGLKPLIVGL